MGIDFHTLNFLVMLAREASLGEVLTLGRQRIHMTPREFDAVVGGGSGIAAPGWSEILWHRLGASSVRALDASGYEGAEIVHDLTLPVSPSLHGNFDTVFDGGTLQHVLDPIAALSNCRDLCRVGGRIVHVVPANNFCGFGFYQFSPELFLSFYEANGFGSCRVFLAKLADRTAWFAYKLPEGMLKPTLRSEDETYLLVVATKTGEAKQNAAKPVQHEYRVKWTRSDSLPSQTMKSSPIVRALSRLKQIKSLASGTISTANPALKRIAIVDAVEASLRTNCAQPEGGSDDGDGGHESVAQVETDGGASSFLEPAEHVSFLRRWR